MAANSYDVPMRFEDFFVHPKVKLVSGARTRRGTPCQSTQLFRKGRCRFHGGMSTGPMTEEGRAAISRAMKARWSSVRSRG